jgi:hypothetical protein
MNEGDGKHDSVESAIVNVAIVVRSFTHEANMVKELAYPRSC